MGWIIPIVIIILFIFVVVITRKNKEDPENLPSEDRTFFQKVKDSCCGRNK